MKIEIEEKKTRQNAENKQAFESDGKIGIEGKNRLEVQYFSADTVILWKVSI